jgi:hypothetical protein
MMAKLAGAYTVEINIETSELSHKIDEIILGKSGHILSQLLALIKNLRT